MPWVPWKIPDEIPPPVKWYTVLKRYSGKSVGCLIRSHLTPPNQQQTSFAEEVICCLLSNATPSAGGSPRLPGRPARFMSDTAIQVGKSAASCNQHKSISFQQFPTQMCFLWNFLSNGVTALICSHLKWKCVGCLKIEINGKSKSVSFWFEDHEPYYYFPGFGCWYANWCQLLNEHQKSRNAKCKCI